MNTNIKKSNKKGFTIIEVMIVLAIAGLILAIIFLAVPALQRNSRNNSRRSDVSHLSGLINEYIANNQGQLPLVIGNGAGQLDLTSENWAIVTPPVTADIRPAPQGNLTQSTISTVKIYEGFLCVNGAVTATNASARSFAVQYKVEGSGNPQDTCIQG